MTEGIHPVGEIIQGTVVAVALDPDGPLCGVFLRGPSGAGKSDLALRLIESCPWQRSRLVCDDVAIIRADALALYVECPENIKDLIEVRGIGILPIGALEQVKLHMICDLGQAPERLPEIKQEKLIASSEHMVPVFAFDAFEISTPLKIRQAMRAFLARLFDGSRQDGPQGNKRHEVE